MQLYFNALYKGNFAQHMASFIVLVIPHTVKIKSVAPPPKKNRSRVSEHMSPTHAPHEAEAGWRQGDQQFLGPSARVCGL